MRIAIVSDKEPRLHKEYIKKKFTIYNSLYSQRAKSTIYYTDKVELCGTANKHFEVLYYMERRKSAIYQ